MTLDQGKSVWAFFDGGAPPTVTLMVTKTGTGTGTVIDNLGSLNCGTNCSEAVPAGNSASLTAMPASGSYFAGYSGTPSCSGTWPDCSPTMDQPRTITATFNTGAFTLAVSKAGTGGGDVMSSIGGIKCGSTCAATLPSGTAVTL